MAATGKSAECFQTMADVEPLGFATGYESQQNRAGTAAVRRHPLMRPSGKHLPLFTRAETGTEFPLLTQKPQEPTISSGENTGPVALASSILPVRTLDVQGMTGADAHPAHPSRPTP